MEIVRQHSNYTNTHSQLTQHTHTYRHLHRPMDCFFFILFYLKPVCRWSGTRDKSRHSIGYMAELTELPELVSEWVCACVLDETETNRTQGTTKCKPLEPHYYANTRRKLVQTMLMRQQVWGEVSIVHCMQRATCIACTCILVHVRCAYNIANSFTKWLGAHCTLLHWIRIRFKSRTVNCFGDGVCCVWCKCMCGSKSVNIYFDCVIFVTYDQLNCVLPSSQFFVCATFPVWVWRYVFFHIFILSFF